MWGRGKSKRKGEKSCYDNQMAGTSLIWKLDPRLEADTFVIDDSDTEMLLLMNDCRWPWLILVPRISHAEEWHQIRAGANAWISQRVGTIGHRLKDFTGCEKINTAALGNVVRQLHIHIIARNEGDPNWPGPVWGFGRAQPYMKRESEKLIRELKELMNAPAVY